MKPLLILARITFVGCLWSVIFIEGVRVILLENWHFDIFWPPHWLHAWNLWISGWVIDTSKEWAFVLILLAFLPLWLTGWIAVSMIPWEMWLYKLIMLPVNLIQRSLNPLKRVKTKAPIIVKKKSYKEIRPKGPRTPIYDYNDVSAENNLAPTAKASAAPSNFSASDSIDKISGRIKKKEEPQTSGFNHSLFEFDDGDDFDLDFDLDKSDIFSDDIGKPAPKPESKPEKNVFDDDMLVDTSQERSERYNANDSRENKRSDRNNKNANKNNERSRSDNKNQERRDDNRRKKQNNDLNDRRDNSRDKPENRDGGRSGGEISRSAGNPVADVLTQKGYDLIAGITVHNTVIDFIGVANNKICVCLLDKEPGDWLADEERFNNEEPLWFSESSHRISPVRKIDLARKIIEDKLVSSGFDLDLEPYVVIQIGNIINAEDMFEIWDDMGIEVTRINRGSPKEIKLFSKTLEEAEDRMEKNRFNELKKLLRNLA